MDLTKEIASIETPSTRSLDWYYHSFPEQETIFTSILTEGIKCRHLINKEGSGNNGKYYISLTKDIGVDYGASAFYSFMKCCTSMIVDNIKTRKCINTYLFHFLANTAIPIRCSGWEDEFQAYKIIEPDKFVGIQCPLYYWSANDHKYYLEQLKKLIIVMKTLEISLPLYDYTRHQGTRVHTINPDAYLELYENKIKRLAME